MWCRRERFRRGICTLCYVLGLTFLICISPVKSSSVDRQGPFFIVEPPNRVDFLNSSGAVILCSARGNPSPLVSWIKKDGTPVMDIPGLRHLRPDGSLVFPPFRAEEYRQDVHAAVYRCSASNVVGSIFSRKVHVRAAVTQYYEAQVYDVFVAKGNTAVLKCQIPSFVKEYVSVIAWRRDDGLKIHSEPTAGGRYSVFSTGELHVRNVESSTDGSRRFYCQTKHRISGEVKQSSTAGQIIITDPHSTFPPRITDRKPHISVLQGETVELPCSAEGYPVPIISWHKEEGGRTKPIFKGQRQIQVGETLVIRQALVQDSGKYFCIVNNTIGHEKIETELLVTVPLSVALTPRQIVAEEGDSITFNCSILGFPVQTVLWMKNQQSILTNSRIRLLSKELLQINPVIREDKGVYQCFAINDWESAQGTSEISLGDDPPVFAFTFTDQILEPDRFVSLKCAASGTPLPQITWTLDGSQITESMRIRIGDFVTNEGFVNSFVNITSLRTEDGGQYECHATNEIATISHVGRLNVFGPPFVRPMKNVSILAGDTLVIKCPAAGYPIERITWEKGSTRLPQDRRQVVYQNGTFIIASVDRSTDEGSYRCIAENRQGESAFGDVNVKVLVAPVVNPFHFPSNLKEGMRSITTCSVLEGDPPIVIKWYKDGRPITDTVDSSNEFSSTLFIKRVTYEHNGNYTCVATNAAAAANHTAMMIVNVPPQWRISPSDKSVIVGQNAVIDCQADGFPQPRIWWEKSLGPTPGDYRTIISNSHIHTLENGSLMIREAEQSDAGFYLCQAANDIGSGLSKVVELTVHVSAYFKAKYTAQTLKKGERAQLTCQAYGELPVTITWSKERQSFDPASDPRYELHQEEGKDNKISRITIHSVDRRDSALFTCIAVNSYGQDDTNIQLIIQEPPDSPSNILASEIGSRSITLRWAQPYTGNSPVTAYKIQYKLASDSWTDDDQAVITTTVSGRETSTMLRGLKPVSSYHVRLSAENALGWSDSSQVVHITTGEEVPEGPPTSVHAVSSASNSVRVTWQPPKKEARNGVIKGYYVGYKPYGSSEAYVFKTVDVQSEMKEEVILTSLKRATKYSIMVQALNSKGPGPPSEELVVETLQNDPPVSPNLTIFATTASSIQLKWSMANSDDTPVTGYFLYYKKQYGTWEERQVPSHQTSYTFHDLYCGTQYQFHLVAFNSVGKGKPSDIVAARTQGSVPVAPKREALLSINSTSVTLHLNTWHGGGCPINFFVVQYKAHQQHEWILVSNNIIPEQKNLIISDLAPGVWYTILMTAHTDAGPTEAEYVFATLTTSGATVPPLLSIEDRRPAFYKSLSIMVPSACAVVVLIVILIVACVVVKKKRQMDMPRRDSRLRDDKTMEGMSMDVLERKHTGSTGSGSPVKDPLYYPSPYAMSRVPVFRKQGSPESECSQSLRRTLGRHEHIYDVPYPPKWEDDDDAYSHIMETSSVPLHPSSNVYQTPRKYIVDRDHRHWQGSSIIKEKDIIPVHRRKHDHSPNRTSGRRRRYKASSLASDGHSADDSENEGTTYTFSRDMIGSYPDPSEMSEAECDRDHLFIEQEKDKSLYQESPTRRSQSLQKSFTDGRKCHREMDYYTAQRMFVN